MASGAWRVGLCALRLVALPAGRAGAAESPPSSQAAAPAPARTLTARTRIAAAPLLADVDVLERAYRALHPGLARYNTPAQLDASFGQFPTTPRPDAGLQPDLSVPVVVADIAGGRDAELAAALAAAHAPR